MSREQRIGAAVQSCIERARACEERSKAAEYCQPWAVSRFWERAANRWWVQAREWARMLSPESVA